MLTQRLGRSATCAVGLAVCLPAASCEDQPAEEAVYVLDTSRYEPSEPRQALQINNETLLVPLSIGPHNREPTREESGGLVVAYTRLTCRTTIGIDGFSIDDFLSQVGANLLGEDPAQLVEISVDEAVAADWEGTEPGACFSVRVDGSWSQRVAATRVTRSGGVKTSTFRLDPEAVDGVAIFFAGLQTRVSRVSYRILE